MIFRKNRQRQLTIVFDDYTIRFIEVTVKNNQIIVIHHLSTIVNNVIKEGVLDKAKWTNLLKNHLEENNIKAKKVNLVIPNSLVIFRQQIMPDLPLKDLKQIINYELGNTIHFPFKNPIFDFVKVKSDTQVYTEDGEPAIHISLIAASGRIIYPLIEVLKANKLRVNGIDIAAFGLYRLYTYLYPNLKDEPVLFSNISKSGVDLHILYKGFISFTRNVPLNVNSYYQEETKNIDFTKLSSDLSYEIERAINFFHYTLNNRSKMIKSCFIASELDFSAEFYELLKEKIEIDVSPLYYKNNKISDEEINRYKGYEIGIGISLKKEKETDEISLLPKLPKLKKYRIPIRLIAGVLLIILSLLLGRELWEKTNVLEEKKIHLNQVTEERIGKQDLLNKNKEETNLLNGYLTEYDLLSQKQINIVPHLDDLSRALPSNGYISSIKWSTDEAIKIDGTFPSLDIIGQYVQIINQLDWVKNVELIKVQEKKSDLKINQDEYNSRDNLQVEMEIHINLEIFYQKGVNNNE